MTDSGINHLLLIGAYRDNAVHPGHPLMLTLAQIQKSGANINTLTLAPLQQSDVNRLIADTLSPRRRGTATDKVAALAAPLTELVYQKTKGNPFFITQFLKSLYEDGIIRFVPPGPDSPHNGGGWQCDISKVRELALTDDVVEFVALQLQKLPAATQEVLKLAACIGHQFDLNTLAIVLETSPSAAAADLWKALQDGLVQPTSEVYKLFQEEEIEIVGANGHSPVPIGHSPVPHLGTFDKNATYQFLHDRIQQAAYALIPPPLKKATHLKIGQLLLHNTPAAESEDKIFDTVNQLNYGIDLITAPPERLQLAELNLKCGRKAKNATAYSAASTYLSIGRQLLTPDAWQTQYEIALHLHIEGADAAYLSSSFSQMEELGQIVLENATNLLDKVKIYEIQLAACTAQMQPQTAVEIGLQVLQLLGVTFPAQPTPSDVERELGQTAAMFAEKHIPDLQELPAMTEPEKLAALRILSSLVSPTYISAPLLLPLVIVKMVHLSVTYGNAPLSSFAYGLYGLVLTGIILDIDTGYQFGELALNILERFHANYLKTKIFYTVGVHIIYGKHHVKEIIPLLKEGYARGLETGELELGYSAKEIAQYSYLSGAQLADLETDVAGYCQALAQFKQADALNYTRIVHQVLLNLLGSRKNPCDLAGAVYDEQQMLPFHLQAKDGTGLHFLYFHKMLLCYLFEQPEQAFENARQAEQYLGAVTGQLNVPLFSFYDSLVRLAICGLGQAADHTTQLEAVQTNQAKLQKWAEHAPMNFRHKWKLVQAEIYRVQGDKLAAIETYDNAIALAQEYEYLNDEALACELAAKFYLKWGKPKIASAYLMDAYYAYARWGAAAKIEDLENRYPLLLAPVLQQHQIYRQNVRETLAGSGSVSSTAKTITGSTATSEMLDLPAIIKASQALSSEIHLNQLLANLMEVTLENAGADAGALILKEEDSWVVAIHCTKLQNCLFQSLLADQSQVVPLSVVNYVKHAKETLVFDDATAEGKFAADPYMIKYQPKSVLCTPIRDRGKVKGILYLENKLTVGAFTRDRVQLLNILVAQAAISLENARLYRQSQEYAQKLEHSLHDLQEMQLQLVQSEKMSALGSLVAGVAHEINNPLGFLAGNLQPARDYVRDLFGLIDLYQEQFPEPGPAIASEIAAIDLEYLREDLPSLLASMNAGVERIRHISDSLRIFSRSDTDVARPSNLHDGIDSTLLILKHRLKATEQRPAIQVLKDYGDLPLVECFLGQLNQVFMNLLANAIDAIEESNQGLRFSQIKAHPNQIKIKTALNPDGDSVSIRIRDNGTGMSEAVKQKIFDHLFTTKTVGKGTGLGLSIVRQIIMEKHGGKIEVHSTLGQGAEFVITIPVRLSHPTEVQD
ncbi:MAG: hypothetical protein Fur0025_46920 [Oscillatoriaceae cyanobacterium]